MVVHRPIIRHFRRDMVHSSKDPFRVAVIDIGSNTIKSLVLEGPAPGKVVHTETIEARLETEIVEALPRLTKTAIKRGTAAVGKLWTNLLPFKVNARRMVATSAVRDAVNGRDFVQRVESITGMAPDVLSGDDEARGVAFAVAADPLFQHEPFLTTSDLGGGSLEMVALRNQTPVLIRSFQIGAVRFLKQFFPGPAGPMNPQHLDRVSRETTAILRPAVETGKLREASVHIATGGAFTITRGLLAERAGLPIEAYGPAIDTGELIEVARETGALTPAERTRQWNIPPGRADVFPIALAILKGLADALESSTLCHSFANLRKGLAIQLLNQLNPACHE